VSMNSYNHYALGAVVGFFYRRLAGIAPKLPGFRRISVRPVWLPRVGEVAARYESCVGTIETRIAGDADGIAVLDLRVPPNSVAEIELPACFGWREGGVPLGDCTDIMLERVDGGLIRAEVGSGHYHFTR
jgi:alpha-L-rhamnosidase